ncbi:universal stress protein [Nocardioides sp. Soil805]|uniref:universal stress protein n=1 Tax=Nocardioides sp. Soil805 TaxID=1736416 RepID=UPI0007025561|nr:universal stress protein [Nocardioides sp. Soil805]KRF34126.1 hypothetical protein ASG94_15415 [Nocardioides sp. Soil805]
MTTGSPFPGAVVVGLDHDRTAQDALHWACTQARLEHRPLVAAHAAGRVPGRSTVAELRGTLGRRDHRLVRQARQVVGVEAPESEVQLLVTRRGPRRTLLDASAGAAMLVVGPPDPIGPRWSPVGSVAASLVMRATCPVVIVREGPDPRPRVAVGTEGTGLSTPALAFAFRVAASRDWAVTVLHCFWDSTGLTGDLGPGEPGHEGRRSRIAALVEPHRRRHPGVDVTIQLSRGFADQRLVAASRDHALVVVAHHRLPLLQRIVWGNVTPLVVREAPGSVAVVPSESGPSGA